MKKERSSGEGSPHAQSVLEGFKQKLQDPSFLPSRSEIIQAFASADDPSEAWQTFVLREWDYFELLNRDYVEALGDYVATRVKSLKQEKDTPLTILEIGAGDGRLTHFLTAELEKHVPGQTRLIAVDNGEWNIAPAFPVEQLDQRRALMKYKPTIVICSWMPPGTDWSADFRATSSVQEYTLIGESYSTGDNVKTWNLYSSEEIASYEVDGFIRVDLPYLDKLQICRIDWYPSFVKSQTTAFRRQSSLHTI